MYIKNTTNIDGVWVGQGISAGTYVEIEPSKTILWANNDTVITDIGSGSLIVSSTTDSSGHIISPSAALNKLRGDGPTDTDGAPLTRTKTAPAGWNFQLRCISLCTAKIDGCFTKKTDGTTSGGFITVVHKDDNNTTLTVQEDITANCTQTIIYWEPTWDYEMIGGSFYQQSAPTDSIILNVVAVPDVPLAYGGSVPFAIGLDLLQVGSSSSIKMDGRSSKRLIYSATYHTNKFQIHFRHAAGIQHKGMLVFEMFKPNGV